MDAEQLRQQRLGSGRSGFPDQVGDSQDPSCVRQNVSGFAGAERDEGLVQLVRRGVQSGQ